MGNSEDNLPLKLLCVLAHPDDESLGAGGILAKYAAEGVETYLVTATRGERGWAFDDEEYPGPTALGKIREAELLAAADHLGLRAVHFLDYIDGDLDQADPMEAITKIARHIRQIRPQVVLTFGPDGIYGHPDHIAISQFTNAASAAAADCNFQGLEDLPVHSISKLYYLILNQAEYDLYLELFGDIIMQVDGVARQAVAWPDWAITTCIDARAHWSTALQAIKCHKTQLSSYGDLDRITEQQHMRLWAQTCIYRAFSLVNGGRLPENDLFAGLR